MYSPAEIRLDDQDRNAGDSKRGIEAEQYTHIDKRPMLNMSHTHTHPQHTLKKDEEKYTH